MSQSKGLTEKTKKNYAQFQIINLLNLFIYLIR